MRNAILKVQPNLKGKIDRFGGTPDGELRYTIAPYLLYKEVRELERVDRCASHGHKSDAGYYGCFILYRAPQDLHSEPSKSMRPSNVRKLGGWGQTKSP